MEGRAARWHTPGRPAAFHLGARGRSPSVPLSTCPKVPVNRRWRHKSASGQPGRRLAAIVRQGTRNLSGVSACNEWEGRAGEPGDVLCVIGHHAGHAATRRSEFVADSVRVSSTPGFLNGYPAQKQQRGSCRSLKASTEEAKCRVATRPPGGLWRD